MKKDPGDPRHWRVEGANSLEEGEGYGKARVEHLEKPLVISVLPGAALDAAGWGKGMPAASYRLDLVATPSLQAPEAAHVSARASMPHALPCSLGRKAAEDSCHHLGGNVGACGFSTFACLLPSMGRYGMLMDGINI